METMNQRLIEARKAAGYITATEAAEAHGWVEPTYLAHENGTRGIPISKAKLYARAYRISLEWLIDGRGTAPASEGPEADRRSVLKGIKLGLQFAGVEPESVAWYDAITNALREYDALPADGAAAAQKGNIKHLPTGARR